MHRWPSADSCEESEYGTEEAMATVAVVALGAMGRPMVRRLIDAGHNVVLWSRNSAGDAPAEAY